MNHYLVCLLLAGANVIEFKSFGDYQGTWFAVLDNGSIVRGSYGSCSSCDAFYAEFDNDSHDYGDDWHNMQNVDLNCPLCCKMLHKMALFGKDYLDTADDRETVVRAFEEQAEWDYNAKEVLVWLESHG